MDQTIQVGCGSASTTVQKADYTGAQYEAAKRAVEALGIDIPAGATIVANGNMVEATDTIGPDIATIEIVQEVPDLA